MGSINQRIYLTRHLPAVDGPVVEIGSRDYGNTTSFRDVHGGNDYVGVDMEAGTGVDIWSGRTGPLALTVYVMIYHIQRCRPGGEGKGSTVGLVRLG